MSRPYKDLAQAIVLQAVKDWRVSMRRLRKRPDNPTASRMVRECERFFHSPWFTTLTGMDGNTILQKLKEEMEDDA